MSLRLPDELADEVRRQAKRAGQSLNGWITTVLSAAVDPAHAGSESERIRERLARAGLLSTPETTAPRPASEDVEHVRAAAGTGTPLDQLVSDGRR